MLLLREVADEGVTKGLAMIDKIEKEVGQQTANRGRHVVEEICRVRRCATLLKELLARRRADPVRSPRVVEKPLRGVL